MKTIKLFTGICGGMNQREHRLCGGQSNVSPSSTPSASPQGADKNILERAIEGLSYGAKDFVTWLSEKTAVAAGEAAELFGRFALMDLPQSVWNGLKSAFSSIDWQAGAEQAMSCIKGTISFFENAPADVKNWVAEQLADKPDPDIETISNLTSQEKWMEAFGELNQKDRFDVDHTTPLPDSGTYGPKKFLMSLPQAERIRKLKEYASGLLIVTGKDGEPVDGQDMISNLIGGFDNSNKRKGKIATALGAMRLVLGQKSADEVLDKRAKKIAKESLLLRYFTRKDGTYVPKQLLHHDFEQALRYYPSLTADQMEHPDLLAQDKLPDSHFKGLLKLKPEGLDISDVLREEVELQRERLAGRASKIANSRRLTGEISGQVRAKAEREGKSVTDIWYGMSGFEKMALIAAAAYLLAKKPGIGLGVAAVYFGRKFMLDDAAPADSMGRMVRKTFDKVKEVAEGALSKVGYEFPEAGDAYVDLMVTYMDTQVRENLEDGVIGFSLLANAPMDKLAAAFDFDKGNTDGGDIRIVDENGRWDKSSRLYGYIQEEIHAKRLNDRKARAFFSNHENRRQVCDALSHVFYAIGSDLDKNADRKQMVENAAASLGPGESYDDLTGAAHEKYAQLVREGMGAAGDESLAERVRRYVGKTALSL